MADSFFHPPLARFAFILTMGYTNVIKIGLPCRVIENVETHDLFSLSQPRAPLDRNRAMVYNLILYYLNRHIIPSCFLQHILNLRNPKIGLKCKVFIDLNNLS